MRQMEQFVLAEPLNPVVLCMGNWAITRSGRAAGSKRARRRPGMHESGERMCVY